jgi:hypothetical protein
MERNSAKLRSVQKETPGVASANTDAAVYRARRFGGGQT